METSGASPPKSPANPALHFPNPPSRANSLRWHPSGHALCLVSEDGIVVVGAAIGSNFGQAVFLTAKRDGQGRHDALWSPDGRVLAFAKSVPARDADGRPSLNYAGKDFTQIFTLAVPNLRTLFP